MSLTGNAESNRLHGSISALKQLQGYSAYEIAVINGFSGTEEEWLASLGGATDITGKVRVTSSGVDQNVVKAIDNGNTITIICEGEHEEVAISINGRTELFVSGHIYAYDESVQLGTTVPFSTVVGATIANIYCNNTSYLADTTYFGIVIHYV